MKVQVASFVTGEKRWVENNNCKNGNKFLMAVATAFDILDQMTHLSPERKDEIMDKVVVDLTT